MNRHSGTPALLNYFPRIFYAACQSCGRTFLGLLTAWPAALLPAFAAFLLLTSGNASAQDSVESDRAVLVALYNATDGPNWRDNTHWLSNEPLSEWRGVGVNDDGRVTELSLSNNQLTGEIPVELSQLYQLQYLILYSNQLTGEIPVELSQLYQLQDLSLSSNQLTGEIPVGLSQLSQLQRLRLYGNQLTGEIPVGLSQLSQLQYLSLSNNQLTGEIPVELSQLYQLQRLYLSRNQLTGEIPVELSQLYQLQDLSLYRNQLTGEIPVELSQLSQLQRLRLYGNQLTGEIPVGLSQLSQLQYLYLSRNQLTGEIPVELSQLSQLQRLYLDSNQLTGEIPAELSQLSQLRNLWLYGNQLTGEIPVELGNLAQLNGLYLHGNELNGPIPSWLVNLTELRELSLWSNQLTGTIPPEVAPAQDRAALVVLYLQTDGPNWTDNTNWIPREPLSEWHGVSTDEQGRVEELRLSANGLNGTIGAELGVLTRLTGLYLNDNELTGTIPPELENLTQLQVFDIRNTGLCVTADSELHTWIATIQDFQGTATCGASNLVANFSNGNNGAFNSRVYLWNPSGSSGDVTVRVFTLPLTGGLAQELTTAPLNLGTLGAKSALNVKVAEDILAPLGITLPYTNNEGDLTLEFTIQAVDVRGATQVFSSSLAFGTHPLQEIPSTSSGSPTVLVANFMNGNSDAFNSRAYLFNPSDSDGNVTVRVFTLPLSDGTAQELTGTPLDLGTLEARSALNLKLVEDILIPLGITLPYTTDGGNLTLEFTIQAADVRGTAQVFSSSFAFGVYPLQEIPSTSSGSPTVLVANFMNGNSDAFSSRAYLFNPSDSDGNVTVRVFTLPLSDGTAQELTGTPLDLGTLEARSALNLKLVEDILIPLGIALPYTTDGGNLTLEFTIQAADVRGTAQVFSSSFAFGTYPLQQLPRVSVGTPTGLVANFMNGNNTAFNSRVYLWNPSESSGDVTVRVFTLPLTGGLAQELTTAPLNLGTLGAKSALNVKLVENILEPLEITLPYTTDGGNLTLEFTIQAADVRGTAQVFSSSFAFGTYPLQNVELITDGGDVPPTPLAPADEAAFNTLFVGKRAVTNYPTFYVDFVSPGRFRETEGSDIWTGSYTYRNTGSNTGTLTLNYDDGDRCTVSLTFDSTTAGTASYTCNDGSSGAYNWQLVEISATGTPDLVVQTPSVSDSSPNAGEAFTLSATVRNQGNSLSTSTTLRYYHSLDATISTGDTQVGTGAVSGLAAAASSDQSISLTAPSSAGTYYYGACVDPVSGEYATRNNCSRAVTVTVASSTGDPWSRSNIERFRGTWQFTYTKDGAAITDTFVLNIVVEQDDAPGEWGIGGIQDDGTIAVLFYSRDSDSYVLGPDALGEIEELYSFNLTSPTTVSGCYYEILSSTSLSSCYPMTGVRTSSSTLSSVKRAQPNTTAAHAELGEIEEAAGEFGNEVQIEVVPKIIRVLEDLREGLRQ